MPINIGPQNSPFKPKSLTEFITLLRRGTKMSIVESGRFLLWETFRNADFRKKYETKAQLIQAFGPRIIILGLATANNFRPNKLTIDGFYGLCTTYLQIPTSISDPEFLDNEAQQIYELLKASSTKPNHIQCSASIASIPEENRKLTIPVVIIGYHVTAEFMPFHAFADQAGILKELNIGPIEFHSWNSLEHVFSGTSVAQFERALLKKWKEYYPKSIEDISELYLERDTPAHNYEYLDGVRKEIFIRDFL
jgi:hypothetical protein